MTAGTPALAGVGLDPLRDSRHREARAARELLAALAERDYALQAIMATPSKRTLLTNAEARAMFEYARRVMESDV